MPVEHHAEDRWRFGLLGPIEARGPEGNRLKLGGMKQRVIFAVLTLEANHVVSVDRLVDALWHDAPPEKNPHATLQVHMSQLRRTLGAAGATDAGWIEAQRPGYVMRAPPGSVDIGIVEGLVTQGRAALNERRFDTAAELLRRADATWRGPALAELAGEPFSIAPTVALEEMRRGATDLRVDADLGRGMHGELIGELRARVLAEPLRERPWAQLMVALYRTGRQVDALRAYTEARTLLAEELGVEPSSELRQLELAILNQDPSLSASANVVANAIVGGATTRTGTDQRPAFLRTADGVRRPIRGAFTIGRAPSNHLSLDDPKVSRRHAIIRPGDHGYLLFDRGSTNGTVVNGQTIERHPLIDGDVIRIGATDFTFGLDDSA